MSYGFDMRWCVMKNWVVKRARRSPSVIIQQLVRCWLPPGVRRCAQHKQELFRYSSGQSLLQLCCWRMASSELRRPKSANPNRRLRTATHKVTDPRIRPEQQQPTADESTEQSPLSVWTEPLDIDDAVAEPVSRRSGAKPLQRQTPSPTSNYDSLMTFECIQKASALRVLAKTLDRQRDVMQSSSTGGNPAASESSDSRKTTPPPVGPRKLRPLGREYSGPF